jgi:twinkle protein
MTTKIIETKTKAVYEIEVNGSGNKKLRCPACNDSNKDKREKSMSWDNNNGVGHCFRPSCDAKFVKKDDNWAMEKKKYELPPPIERDKPYSFAMSAWFMNRGIFESTMKNFGISEGEHYFAVVGKTRNAIMFPYFRDKKLVNVKYRDGEKNFTLTSGAELIPFNLDSIKGCKEVIITEGEFDCMVISQVGFSNVISVPNGASTGNNNLSWLDNCIEYFDEVERIILATDKDNPGINLRTQLSARLGVERCMKVEFGDCKDANEVLQLHGSDALKDIINAAEPFPIDGAFTVVDVEDELNNIYLNGLKRGYTIDMPDFDKLMSFELGRLYIGTGIPSHGKSKFVDFIVSRLNLKYKMRAAFFSPETFPIEIHIAAISELLIGKKFGQSTMTQDEYLQSKQHINEQYHWIMPEDGFTVDNILSKARQLILRKGVQIIVLDPYNKLEHQVGRGESETQYISKFIDKLVSFAQRNNIILILVAHPTKMKKQLNGSFEVPTLYDISGSANFFNKTDFGFTVYRNFEDNYITVIVNKVKFKHLGETGSCEWKFNLDNNRFSPYSFPGGAITYDNVNWIANGLQASEVSYGNPRQQSEYNVSDGMKIAPF